MLFLQILGVVAASVFTLYVAVRFFLASVNIWAALLSIPALALAIWQPFAYGWL